MQNMAHTFLMSFPAHIKEAYERFDALIHAYRLMGSNYHLLIETPWANKQLNFIKYD